MGFGGNLEYFLRQQGIPILDIEYTDHVTVRGMTWIDWDNFTNMITEITNGKAEYSIWGKFTIPGRNKNLLN